MSDEIPRLCHVAGVSDGGGRSGPTEDRLTAAGACREQLPGQKYSSRKSGVKTGRPVAFPMASVSRTHCAAKEGREEIRGVEERA
ncbi:hypothetical protein VZT92_010597 [Zoarces viviparus]|uniref:Uncharacterized protein n=1 Tax=Zoarces viviparus TaxID=48416 RepID=A0AAW1F970_ZOAVI